MKKHSTEYFLSMAKRNDWRLPSSIPWRTVREVVLLRDKHQCQCQDHKETTNPQKFHVHHIRYPEWDLKDLITLCDECHAKQPKQTLERELKHLPLNEWERIQGLVGYLRTHRRKEKLGSAKDENRRILNQID